MERRTFLHSIERAALGLACAGLSTRLLGCVGVRYVPAAREDRRLVVRLADVGDEPFALVEHPGMARPILLHRGADGTYTAVSTRCGHRGCQVEPAGDRLACPCHGSEYRLTGEVLRGPTERPLERFVVRTDADTLHVQLPETL